MTILKVILLFALSIGLTNLFAQDELSDLCLEKGKASYYGKQFHGKKTANGEKFDQMAFTAAHRTLPFGTLVKVTNLANYESVLVRINDRGPFNRHRILDLSRGAAESIGIVESGIGLVLMECIFEPTNLPKQAIPKIDSIHK